MPKRFIIVLVVIQGIITYLNWLLYKVLILAFPYLQLHHRGFLWLILALSFAFYPFATACHYAENFFLKWGYILASIWLVFFFYALGSSAIALLIFDLTGFSLSSLSFIALSLSILMTLYGLINARIVRTTQITVKLANLPPAWKNRTAIVAADLHFGHVLSVGTSCKIVKLINKQNPDIVFLPGDFYDGVYTDYPRLANEFKKIIARLGSYFVSGNHEVYAGYERCEQAIKNAGIKILEDEKTEIEGLQILGLAYKPESDETVAQRLKNMNFDANKASVLLKHVPSHLSAIEKMGVSVQLSGHTHQAQIWPFRFITHKLFKGFDYGLKTLGKMQIFTSCGVGTWGPPMRIFTKSELVKITFQ